MSPVTFCDSNALVHYSSVLQKGVTVSTTEAEYVALSDSSKDVLWLSHILAELNEPQNQVPVYQDNIGSAN